MAFLPITRGGVAAGAGRDGPAHAAGGEAPAKAAAAPTAPAKPADTPAPKAAAALDKPQPVPKKLIARLEKKPEKGAAAAQLGRLELAVAPSGQGLGGRQRRGRDPPRRG